MKLYNIHYVDDIQWVIYFIQDIYRAHITTTSPERREYFRKFAMITDYMFKIILFMYLSTVSTCFMYPFLVYFTQNEVVPIMPLFIPGINENTTFGFIILTIYHIFMILLASFGVVATDFFLALIIISSLIFAKIISLELQQIHIDLEEKDSRLKVKSRFRNILRMHKEMCEYVVISYPI